MFHIHTLDGVKFNVPLEKLKRKNDISRLKKNYPVRKTMDIDEDSVEEKPSDKKYSYAEKTYREAVNIKNEREPIFHAYKIMTSPVLTIKKNMKVVDAWEFFNNKEVGHMPVVSNENEIIGIVSIMDMLRYITVEDKIIIKETDKLIEDIMTEEVITASRLTDIRRIAKVMFENHIGTMPILDDNKLLVGIITRSDILYALINYPSLKLWA